MKFCFFLSMTLINIAIGFGVRSTYIKAIAIEMIGESDKDIYPLYIIDSSKKMDLKDQSRMDILYVNNAALNTIFSIFEKETENFILLKNNRVKPFGTFSFTFYIDDNREKTFVRNRVQSAVLFQKIICQLSTDDASQNEILIAIKDRLNRINW